MEKLIYEKKLLAFSKKKQKKIPSVVPQHVGNYKIKLINIQDSTQLTLLPRFQWSSSLGNAF